MLLWCSVAVAFTYASQRTRAALAASVRADRLVDDVLTLLFEKFLAQPETLPSKAISLLGNRKWLPDEIQTDTDEALVCLALKTFHSWVVRAPAVVRMWWQHTCPKRYDAAVKQLTSAHISPSLSKAKLISVTGSWG